MQRIHHAGIPKYCLVLLPVLLKKLSNQEANLITEMATNTQYSGHRLAVSKLIIIESLLILLTKGDVFSHPNPIVST